MTTAAAGPGPWLGRRAPNACRTRRRRAAYPPSRAAPTSASSRCTPPRARARCADSGPIITDLLTHLLQAVSHDTGPGLDSAQSSHTRIVRRWLSRESSIVTTALNTRAVTGSQEQQGPGQQGHLWLCQPTQGILFQVSSLTNAKSRRGGECTVHVYLAPSVQSATEARPRRLAPRRAPATGSRRPGSPLERGKEHPGRQCQSETEARARRLVPRRAHAAASWRLGRFVRQRRNILAGDS